MNWDTIKGNWKQLTGSIQSKWGELTNDEIDQVQGDRERLAGLIQERYGVAKEEAENQIDAFIAEHKSAA
ncbi:CsbD family protein [Roseobacter sp. YSTF-M11]|uniref:CsbD family protein n=1 Tax=Roseobacter insulae TaxID=2859783 RepID=A0A9X1G067_9RHOB|nr:CsbD family protein [Roseobacter insulae]MBW4710657.1 CsbD family protein [Roseobacter insulae]